MKNWEEKILAFLDDEVNKKYVEAMATRTLMLALGPWVLSRYYRKLRASNYEPTYRNAYRVLSILGWSSWWATANAHLAWRTSGEVKAAVDAFQAQQKFQSQRKERMGARANAH